MSLFKPLLGTTLPLILATVFSAPVRAQQVINVDLRPSTQAETLSSTPFVVADRYDWRDNDYHRYDTERHDHDNWRRDEHHRVWIPGHWDNGFLGIGRHWIPGHYA